jgi:hypothetical protein
LEWDAIWTGVEVEEVLNWNPEDSVAQDAERNGVAKLTEGDAFVLQNTILIRATYDVDRRKFCPERIRQKTCDDGRDIGDGIARNPKDGVHTCGRASAETRILDVVRGAMRYGKNGLTSGRIVRNAGRFRQGEVGRRVVACETIREKERQVEQLAGGCDVTEQHSYGLGEATQSAAIGAQLSPSAVALATILT